VSAAERGVIMSKDIRHMMQVDEAVSYVKKWRLRHFNKKNTPKDVAMITLCAEVMAMQDLLNELSANAKLFLMDRRKKVIHLAEKAKKGK